MKNFKRKESLKEAGIITVEEHCELHSKQNLQQAGITLVALVVTIIVLLILAGVTLTLALSNNGVMNRAQFASNTWANATKDETGMMEELGQQIDDLSNVNSGGASTEDPAVEYDYNDNAGVVEASTLVPGDLINYYYKDSNGQIQTIPCVVIYGSNSEQGLQVISVDSVKNVILGCSEDGSTIDPKAVETFASGTPAGYGNTSFEKARWSYNHARATLNGYAQDYLGNMAISARCIGTPVNNVILIENENDDMDSNSTISSSSYDNKVFYNYYNNKFKLPDSDQYKESLNRDMENLDNLGVVKTKDASSYWLCSRSLNMSMSFNYVRGEVYSNATCRFIFGWC